MNDLKVKSVLQEQPLCSGILPSFWVTQNRGVPPVWVDADVSIERTDSPISHAKIDAGAPLTMTSGKRLLRGIRSTGTMQHLKEVAWSTLSSTSSGSLGVIISTLFGSSSQQDMQIDYSMCLSLYANTHNKLENDKSVNDERYDVLYSTHKATPAMEVLCW